LDEARSKAAAGNQLIIADMYADWCGWCKKMDAETWSAPQVIQQQGKYVFLKLNAEKESDGIALRKKFLITSFPTVMVLNSDGSEFDRLEGYLPAQKFLQTLNEVVSDPNSLGNLKLAETRDSRNLELRSKLAMQLFEKSYFSESRTRFEEIVTQDPDNKSGLKPSALFYLALCQASQRQWEQALTTIDRLQGQYPASEKFAEASLLSGEILLNLGRRDQARTRIQGFLKSYPTHRLAPQARRLLAEL
jgi:thioredoxin-like negative regulator of GroEL